MRQLISGVLCLVLGVCTASGTTHTVTSSGFTFSPSTVTISLGDTVVFSLGSIHTAREVSQDTWNADGTTSNGGFDLPSGGGTVVLQTAGTHYYVCVPHASFGMKGTIVVNGATGVREEGNGSLPQEFALRQNYPNPFNPSTVIGFQLPQAAGSSAGGSSQGVDVTLAIFDVTGKKIATVVSGMLPPGSYTVRWDASAYPSGVYYYRLVAGTYSATKKLIFIK